MRSPSSLIVKFVNNRLNRIGITEHAISVINTAESNRSEDVNGQSPAVLLALACLLILINAPYYCETLVLRSV